MKWKQHRKGSIAVEMAVCFPLLCLMMVMMIDLWRLQVNHTSAIAMAEAGATYGATDIAHANDTTGIACAALKNKATEDNPAIVSSVATKQNASGGTDTYVTVTVTVPFVWFSPVPDMPDHLTASRTYIVRRTHTKG